MPQYNRKVVAPTIPIGGMNAYKIKEFLRMNPLEFSVSNVEEDLNGFIDEVYKTHELMEITSRGKLN